MREKTVGSHLPQLHKDSPRLTTASSFYKNQAHELVDCFTVNSTSTDTVNLETYKEFLRKD